VFERIVAAIDNDPDRSGRVVDAARELAEAFKSDVLVAHVRDLERPAAMVVSTARGGATQPAVHLESEEQARQLVEAAVGWARESRIKLIPLCPFAKAVFDHEQAFHDVLG